MEEKLEIKIDENGLLDLNTQNNFFELQNEIKRLTEKENAYKELIKQEMERLGILRLEIGDKVYIDYYPESVSKSLDTTRIKKELPEIVESYTKETKKSAFIKVNWRKEKDSK